MTRKMLGMIAGLCLVSCGVFAQVHHTEAAAEALFRRSDLSAAMSEANQALKSDPADARALFVAMEVSALNADDAAVLEFATRLCAADDSELCEIAAARIEDLAGNTRSFREAASRVQGLISSGNSQSGRLRLALVAAAADGAPEFDMLVKSRESGLLTDWEIVGPLGRHPNQDFDRIFPPQRDGLNKGSYASRRVTRFQFLDGKVDVPEAQRSAGIYYAAANADLDGGGEWRVWVETPGTLEVFIDGVSVLRKDDRAAQQPNVAWTMRRLDDGKHRVIVKFLPSALPFRVAIMPPAGGVKRKNNKPVLHAGPEAEFVSVSLQYWRGDNIGTVRRLQRASTLDISSALLLAQAWHKASGAPSGEARAVLLRAEKRSADIALLQLVLAQQDLDSDRVDDALGRLKPILRKLPDNETVLHLLARLAVRQQWRSEAAVAYERLVQQHPSCPNLREAGQYLASSGEYLRAEAIVPRMKSCVPGSLLYATWLSDSGRHGEAARTAAEIVLRFPLSREALAFQFQQAQFAGDKRLADSALKAVAQLSPDDALERFTAAGMAYNPRSAGFSNSEEFYAAYRRDGVKLAHDLRGRTFSGGPAVTLLQDKVALLGNDGRTAVYVHTVTRVLDRNGIQTFGEVAVPAGANLLELRTIKPDGTVSEPELNQHKPTVSMPALSPGDAIELEYVIYHAGQMGIEANRDAFEFVFGSFNAPVMNSLFAVISPNLLTFHNVGDVPRPTDSIAPDGSHIRTWARNDIAQSLNEGMLPGGELLPLVRVSVPQDEPAELRRAVREAAVSASRVGLRAALLADSNAGAGYEDLARALYTRVVTTIAQDESDFTTGKVTCAEETLANHQGSRSAALLALAHASGLQSSLALARDLGEESGQFRHPLVVFHLPGRDIVTDPESDGMPFGVLGPAVERSKAMAIPLNSTDERAGFLRLTPLEGDHLSLAEGSILFDRGGSFTARVTITMGAWRATQMRNILRGIPGEDRRQFFEQLAMRLFPGASDADGSVSNELALDLPLRLEVTCTSRHFLDFTRSTVDIDQLVPALGLRRMYASQTARRWPLFIDSLLFESANFRIHLPEGVRVLRRVPDVDLQSEFGNYHASFTPVRDGILQIRREFRVPVQIIRASRYPEFLAFAIRIDEIERQRLTLGIDQRLLGAAN